MDPRLSKAIHVMERRMGEPLEIDEIATLLGLSIHHFHRLFVAEMGEAPAAYLRRIRMDEAAHRLRWSDETTAALAQALGFESRPGFIRAFERQFGVPPMQYRQLHRANVAANANVKGADVTLRDIEPFYILARRYVGDIFQLRAYWSDFVARLPEDVWKQSERLYVGRIHDDYRVTEAGKVRYDCGIAVAKDLAEENTSAAHEHGLSLLKTRSGRYATIRHRGHYAQVPDTYDLLCNGWIAPSGNVPALHPALELYTIPRHRQSAEKLDFMILFPVE